MNIKELSENNIIRLEETHKPMLPEPVKIGEVLIRMKGDIICNRLELSRTAKLIGNIETSGLVINEGAILKGKCQMPVDEKGEDKEAASKKKTEKKPVEETKKEGT